MRPALAIRFQLTVRSASSETRNSQSLRTGAPIQIKTSPKSAKAKLGAIALSLSILDLNRLSQDALRTKDQDAEQNREGDAFRPAGPVWDIVRDRSLRRAEQERRSDCAHDVAQSTENHRGEGFDDH